MDYARRRSVEYPERYPGRLPAHFLVRGQWATNDAPAELMVKNAEDWSIALTSKHIEGAFLFVGQPSCVYNQQEIYDG